MLTTCVIVLSEETADGFLGCGYVKFEGFIAPRGNKDGWFRKRNLDLRESRLVFFTPLEFVEILEFQERGECLHFSCRICYESAEEIYLAEQRLELLFGSWWWSVQDCSGLVLVYLNASMMDKEAQKVASRHTECAFSRVHLEMMSAHTKESLPKIIKVRSAALGFYYHIIDIDFNGRANQIVKDGVHGTLICGTSVFKAE